MTQRHTAASAAAIGRRRPPRYVAPTAPGPDSPERVLLTAEEVAGRLGVTLDFVRRATMCGEIPSVRLGHRTVRYSKDAVDGWWKAKEEAAKAARRAGAAFVK